MRRLLFAVVLAGCQSSKSAPPAPAPEPQPSATKPPGKAPDEMDERMRHCPVAIEGATSTFKDIEGGVRFIITPPADQLDEVRRRGRHLVEFAAGTTRKGHGDFDGKGGGRMKNCPVVTDSVTIIMRDVVDGVQLDVTTDPARVEQLRADTRTRVEKFPFVGATIKSAIATP